MTKITSVNPATGQDITTYDTISTEQVEDIILQTAKQQERWKCTSYDKRSELMNKAADVLEANVRKYAEMMTTEMGKTLKSAKAEVKKCAWVCRYYAENAADFLADEVIETEAAISKICYRPLGIVIAVMPWNYPFWQVFRFAAPGLMAGNACLLKHASNVPGCALLIQEVFEEAGFPRNLFSTLLIPSKMVKSVLENPLVKAATLTGSGPAGSAVAETAGANIKKTVLELGGSDPYIVLEDADIGLAVDQCVKSRLLNTGQSCIGAKRFIVVPEVYDEFLEEFKQAMSDATVGDPMEEVDMGPMAREDLRNEVHDQVERSVKKGAKLVLGGEIPKRPGAYYPATILVDVKPGIPAYSEEIFGPVATVIKAKDEKDAIRVANDSQFGLGACVFTKDAERGLRIATEGLEAGCCFVNQYVKSDPRLPFGGIKSSGYGRELSYYGIREFVNVKTVFVK